MASRVLLLALPVLWLCTSAPALGAVAVDGNADLQVIVKCLTATGQVSRFLNHLSKSGFQSVLGRYLGKQPITLLVPTDAAFDEIPTRLRSRLVRKERIKFIEFHMVKQLYPAGYLRSVLDTAFFETVLSDPDDGPFIYKQPAVVPDTVVLSSQKDGTNDTMSVIVKPDACNLPTRTIGAQIISRVLIPPGLFGTDTQ